MMSGMEQLIQACQSKDDRVQPGWRVSMKVKLAGCSSKYSNRWEGRDDVGWLESRASDNRTGRGRSGALDPDAHVLSEVEDGKGLP